MKIKVVILKLILELKKHTFRFLVLVTQDWWLSRHASILETNYEKNISCLQCPETNVYNQKYFETSGFDQPRVGAQKNVLVHFRLANFW